MGITKIDCRSSKYLIFDLKLMEFWHAEAILNICQLLFETSFQMYETVFLRHKCLCIFMSIIFWIWALSGIWNTKFVCLICYFFAQFFGKMRICGFFPSFSPYNVQIKYFNIIVMNIRFKHWTAIKRKSKLFSLFLLVMFPRKKWKSFAHLPLLHKTV